MRTAIIILFAISVLSCTKNESDPRDQYLGTYTGIGVGNVGDQTISSNVTVKVEKGLKSDELKIIDYDSNPSDCANYTASGFKTMSNGMVFNILSQTINVSGSDMILVGYSNFTTNTNEKYDGGYLNDSKKLIFGVKGVLYVNSGGQIIQKSYDFVYTVSK